jgi:hypothetical protein
MCNNKQFVRFLTLGAMFLSLSISGCATKKATWGDPQTGLFLKYDLRQGQTLNYKRNAESIQSIEMMGQSMKTTTKTGSDYIIEGAGTDDQNNNKTRVTVNDLTIDVNSPQGQITPDTSGLKGKSFGVTFSPKGKEIEFIGIEDLPKISLGMPNAQSQSVKSYFSDLLPQLPDDNLKIGDSWTTPVDKKTQQGPIELTIKGESISILDGLETVQGMECVRINTRTTNTVVGAGSTMGQDIKISGDVKGTSTWYFAYKKGVFVRSSVEEDASMKINLGAMGEIPQTTKAKTTFELVQ